MPNQQPNYSFECPGYYKKAITGDLCEWKCQETHSFTIYPGREGSKSGPRSTHEPDERPEIDGPTECPFCGEQLDHAEILAKALREQKEGSEG